MRPMAADVKCRKRSLHGLGLVYAEARVWGRPEYMKKKATVKNVVPVAIFLPIGRIRTARATAICESTNSASMRSFQKSAGSCDVKYFPQYDA